jgi:hypothetical protein
LEAEVRSERMVLAEASEEGYMKQRSAMGEEGIVVVVVEGEGVLVDGWLK